jgi:hypothetical protein
MWETASGGPTAFQIYAADPIAQSVACLLAMREKDKDMLLGAHRKIVDGKITEVEQLACTVPSVSSGLMDEGFPELKNKRQTALKRSYAPA